jgi:hypothetical protein
MYGLSTQQEPARRSIAGRPFYPVKPKLARRSLGAQPCRQLNADPYPRGRRLSVACVRQQAGQSE